MKKFTVLELVVAMVLICGVAFAGIATDWSMVKGVDGSLFTNVNVGNETAPNYYPIRLRWDVQVRTTDGRGKKQDSVYLLLGTNQTDQFDFSTLQGLKDFRAALPVTLRASFTELIKKAVDTDPSE